ncbi:uncharacterized protein LOC133180180 [Saccostrea echinata]|uniref:uncharacterized protein LOC133180180 n=1 Tax=Saccostrea echinata TaxID=191078 RepID=UPI002A80E76C|nr:uncharacterized protein LOC133180180 [Saccostrea echinata]
MSKVLLCIAVLVTHFNKSFTQTEFRRVCPPNQLDVGIRREPQDSLTTHTCVPGPLNGRCFIQDADGGFNCTADFQLQGGLPNRQSLCWCERVVGALGFPAFCACTVRNKNGGHRFQTAVYYRVTAKEIFVVHNPT